MKSPPVIEALSSAIKDRQKTTEAKIRILLRYAKNPNGIFDQRAVSHATSLLNNLLNAMTEDEEKSVPTELLGSARNFLKFGK